MAMTNTDTSNGYIYMNIYIYISYIPVSLIYLDLRRMRLGYLRYMNMHTHPPNSRKSWESRGASVSYASLWEAPL